MKAYLEAAQLAGPVPSAAAKLPWGKSSVEKSA